MDSLNEERLQKALARAGIASRRACEELILAGRVKVNGKIARELGVKINPASDTVSVDGTVIAIKPDATPQKLYIMLNKPLGYLSTVKDPQGRPTIMDLLPDLKATRLYPVGRLDADTEGLLLLTNDGEFANLLAHPRYGVEKEYLALLDGVVAFADLNRLREGVPIRVEDADTGEVNLHRTKVAKVDMLAHEGSNSRVRLVLKEGKKRQIRLMADAINHSVLELKRVRYGSLTLADLASGKYRSLSKAEVNALLLAAKNEAIAGAPIAGRTGSRPANADRRPATTPAGSSETPPARRAAAPQRKRAVPGAPSSVPKSVAPRPVTNKRAKPARQAPSSTTSNQRPNNPPRPDSTRRSKP